MKKRILSIVLVLAMVVSLMPGMTMISSAAGTTETIVLGDFIQDGDGKDQILQHTLMGIPYKGATLSFSLNEAYRVKVVFYSASKTISKESDWFENGDTYQIPDDSTLLMRVKLKKADDSDISPTDAAIANLVVTYESSCDVVEENKNVADLLKNTTKPVLLHGSDFHGDVIRADRFMEFAQYIEVDQAFMTGDFAWEYGYDLGTAFRDLANNKYSPISDRISLAFGNHDLASVDRSIAIDNLFADRQTYYYKDDTANSLRYIVLDDSIITANSYAQMIWLGETLKSTPDGYGIFIAQHSPDRVIGAQPYKSDISWFQTPRTYDYVYGYTNMVSNIVDAFISRGTYSLSKSVKFDFSDMTSSAEFIAHINGHMHNDALTYVKGTKHRQLLLNIARANAGIKGVNDDLARNMNDRTQDCFNAYVIDRATKQITAYRIGANTTKAGTDRSSITMSYNNDYYNVVFHKNAGDDTDYETQVITLDQKENLKDNNFSREGFLFAGWATKPDGNVVYRDGQTVYNLLNVHGNVDLYAVWESCYGLVSFDGNGAVSGTMLTRKMGNNEVLPLNNYYNPGYIFTGWNTEADGSGSAYNTGENIRITVNGSSITLYAQWSDQKSILPGGYTMVPYIESDGKSYIDTGVIGNQSTGFDVDFISFDECSYISKTYGSIFGAREGSGENELQVSSYSAFQSNGGGIVRINNEEKIAGMQKGIRHTISLHNGVLTNAAGEKYYVENGRFETPGTIVIFCLRDNQTPTQFSKARVYSLKLYDGNKLIREFVPCRKDSDGALGFMDIADGHNVFYGNKGGTFTTASGAVNTVSFVGTDAEFGNVESIKAENGDSVKLPQNDVYSRSNYRLAGWSNRAGGVKQYDCGEEIAISADMTFYPVWEKITDANSEYYLENTKGAYIKTGVIPNQATGFEIDFINKTEISYEAGVYGSMFGVRKGSAVNEFHLSTYATYKSGLFRYGNSNAYPGMINIGIRQCISLHNGIYKASGNSQGSVTAAFESPCEITVFALNENKIAKQFGVMDLYSLKFFEGDTLIRDFVPMEKEGKAGLWDKVEEKFYGNSGKGELFIKRDYVSIKFDANGEEAAGAMDDQLVLKGQKYYLTENAFTNENKTFVGWNTKADGTGETYVDHQTILLYDTDELTLYAQWMEKPTDLPAGVKINAGSDYIGTVVDGQGSNPTLAVEYTAPENVDPATQAAVNAALATFNVGDGNTVLDTIEANIYVNSGGKLTKITNAELSNDIEVLVPYADAVPGQTYTLYHFNGTGFDGPITAEVVTIGSVNYLKFKYNKFSPFIIVSGVGYNTVAASTGDGYTVTYAATAKNGDDYDFSVAVDTGYTLQSVKANGNAFTVGGTTYVDNEDGTYTIKALDDNYSIEVKVTKNTVSKNLTFDANGGTGGAAAAATVVGSYVNVMSAPAPAIGYTFLYWRSNFGGATYNPGDVFEMPDTDVTLTAVYEANAVSPTTYAVTYNTNGAVETAPAVQSYEAGSIVKVTDAAYTQSGKTFLYWSVDTNKYPAGATFVMPSKAVTLTAVWADNATVHKYNVTFNNNGADQSVANMTDVVEGSYVTLPTGLTKTGNVFTGWTIGGTLYAPGSSYQVNAAVSAVATFAPVATTQYTIAYDANGGSGAPSGSSYAVGTIQTVGAKPSTDKTDCIFIGYMNSYTGTIMQPGDKFTVMANTTFTAQWKENDPAPVKYTVTYKGNGNDGGTVPVDSTKYKANDVVTVKSGVPAKTGYTFQGWKFNNVVYTADDNFTINSDVVLSAQWKENDPAPVKYTVTYNSNGGSGTMTDPGSYAEGDIVETLVNTFTKEGYIFVGWKSDYKEESYGGGIKFEMPATDITLTAQWAPDNSDAYIVEKELEAGTYMKAGYSEVIRAYTNDAKNDPVNHYFYLVNKNGTKNEASELPEGLTLGTDGSITGTPTAKVGTYDFYVRVANADGEWISSAKQFSIAIEKADLRVVNAPAATAVYGTKAMDIELTSDSAVVKHHDNDTAVAGTWTWTDNTEETIFSVGTTETINATFTPNDTENYNTVTCDVTPTITAKALTLTGKTVSVTKGSTVTEANVKDLLVLEGIIAGDIVDYTAAYTIDGTHYADAEEAAEALTTLAVADGDYTVTITPAITDNNYSVSGTADGILHVYTKSSKGGGGSVGTAVYSITTDTSKNGTVKCDKTSAAKGASVTITVTPDEGYAVDTVTVKDSSGSAVSVKKKSDTGYTFTMPGSSVTVSATFKKDAAEPEQNSGTVTFNDVKPGNWFYEAVSYVAGKGLMTGVTKTEFAPNESTTRAMAVTMLWRMAGSPEVSHTMTFTDVPEGEWYTKAVRWASKTGIVKGTSDKEFAPDAKVTREELAAMIYRYEQSLGKDLSGSEVFVLTQNDADKVSSWAKEAMNWCVMKGIIGGDDKNNLNPQNNATRAELAVIFMNLDKIK